MEAMEGGTVAEASAARAEAIEVAEATAAGSAASEEPRVRASATA